MCCMPLIWPSGFLLEDVGMDRAVTYALPLRCVQSQNFGDCSEPCYTVGCRAAPLGLHRWACPGPPQELLLLFP